MKPLGTLLPGLPPPEPNAKPIARVYPCAKCRQNIGRNVALCPACVSEGKAIAAPEAAQHWSDVERATKEER